MHSRAMRLNIFLLYLGHDSIEIVIGTNYEYSSEQKY